MDILDLECINIMEELYDTLTVVDFCMCSAFKYCYRYEKQHRAEDLKKARWYIDKCLELTEDKEE